MGSFPELAKALKDINEEFEKTNPSDAVYDNKVLKILWDSEPLEEDWDRFPDVRKDPKDIQTPYGEWVHKHIESFNSFKTPKTRVEYLFLLANSLVNFSKNEDVKEHVEAIYQISFLIDGGHQVIDADKVNKLVNDYEELIKSGEKLPGDSPNENHNFIFDYQTLPVQLRYHRWAIVNKSKVQHTSYMRNRFIKIVAERFFREFLSNNLAESHAKMNTEFLHHMNLPTDMGLADTYRKWIGIFTKSVMLVYYGHYKWDKIKGDFFNKEGEKLPKGDRPNAKVFYNYFDISEKEIRDWGNKYRKNNDI